MVNNAQVREFSYGKIGFKLSLIYFLFIYLGLFLFIIWLSNVVLLMFSLVDLESSCNDFLVTGVALLLFSLLPNTSVNRYNTIQVIDDGLRIRTFFYYYRWKFVPWEDVLGVELSPWPWPWPSPTWVIKVKKLTIWHYIQSLFLFCGLGYVIVVDPMMEDSEELLNIVREKLSFLPISASKNQ